MTPLIRRSFLRLAVALGVTMALPVSASLPAERVGLEAARADAQAQHAAVDRRLGDVQGRVGELAWRRTEQLAIVVNAPAIRARAARAREIAALLAEIPKDAAQPVLLICNTQNRSRAVWQALRERGYTNVRYVEGGMSEWARRGLPLVKPVVR